MIRKFFRPWRGWLLAFVVCVGCQRPFEQATHEAAVDNQEISPFVSSEDDPDDAPSPKKTPQAGDESAPAAGKPKSALVSMPGTSFSGPLAALSPEEEKIAAALRTDVERLAGTIGQRNMPHYPQLVAAANFIEAELRTAGFPPKRQTFDVKGRPCANIEAQLAGGKQADEIVVVGAHYDSNVGTPGANDNGSGVAALLTLARRLADAKPSRTVRFVAFVNEEAPYFETELMGSFVYARRCRERQEKITAMLSLETIGYYSDEADSQKYPIPFNVFYPSTGNFIGFIGNVESGDLVKQVVATFRRDAKFPSEGGALPSQIDGVGWSDHWSFWQMGYPAVMVTDTAAFRYPHYHAAEDTPDKLSYDRMARVVVGLEAVVRDLAEWK
jgi:hypothetical protein